jgi:hypothetical protein
LRAVGIYKDDSELTGRNAATMPPTRCCERSTVECTGYTEDLAGLIATSLMYRNPVTGGKSSG